MNFRDRVAQLQRTRPDKCWLWDGMLLDGYGVVYFEGRNQRVHRVAYELLVGPIPDNDVLDHMPPCTSRRCFNPSHTQPVTREENNRLAAVRRTSCRHGHPWTPENTKIIVFKNGDRARWCRECGRQRNREYQARKYAEKKAHRST